MTKPGSSSLQSFSKRKARKPRTLNWYETAEEFIEKVYEDKDYLTREHISDIAQDFKIEYDLEYEAAFKYAERAVLKHLGWSPCKVCGNAAAMSQEKGEEIKFYCEEHIPPLSNQQSPSESEITQPPSFEDIQAFIEQWLKLYKSEFNLSAKQTLLWEELRDRFDLEPEEAYLLADQSITLPKKHLASTPKESTQNTAGKKSIDENLASPGQARTSEFEGKIARTEIQEGHAKENLASNEGKNDIQEEPRQENLASHPIMSNTASKNLGKIVELAGIPEDLASKFNPGSGEPSYKVIKKRTEFYISANIQGLTKKYKKCNKKGCRCLNGKEHGPYFYLYIKDPITGKTRELYFGRAPE